MMPANHTPAPWQLHRSIPTAVVAFRTVNMPYRSTIAETFGYEQSRLANARLICQAPAMFNMLEKIDWLLANGDPQAIETYMAREVRPVLKKLNDNVTKLFWNAFQNTLHKGARHGDDTNQSI